MKKPHHYVLINANEEIVKHLTKELMTQTDMCRCEKCYLDVCALALNNISSNYVTSRKGQVIHNAMKDISESKIEIVVAVSKAIALVKDSPQHMVSETKAPPVSIKNGRLVAPPKE